LYGYYTWFINLMDAGRALLQEAKSKVIAKKVVTGPMMDEVRNKLQFWYYIQ